MGQSERLLGDFGPDFTFTSDEEGAVRWAVRTVGCWTLNADQPERQFNLKLVLRIRIPKWDSSGIHFLATPKGIQKKPTKKALNHCGLRLF
jgi:hypothetical protein